MASTTNRPSISSLDAQLSGLDEPEMYLRKRIIVSDDDSLEAGDLSDGLSEDEDVLGCPLPSTPEDNELLEAEVIKLLHHFSSPSMTQDCFLSITFLILFRDKFLRLDE